MRFRSHPRKRGKFVESPRMKYMLAVRAQVFASLLAVMVGAISCATANTRAPASIRESHSRCGTLSERISRGDIPCLTQELIELKFPELQSAWVQGRIKFRSFQSNAYFLKTAFLSGHIKRDRSKRIYSIDVNDLIYDLSQEPTGAPSIEAVQGILAHELVHLMDYENSTPGKITRMGVNIVISPSKVERDTDEEAFERGYHQGIKLYREWIYGKLTPKELRQKRKRYYTPDEIDEWVNRHGSKE